MEDFVEQTLLYDFYGELLTEHQKQIYEDYVCNNLSTSEIAAEHEISRQAAHDMVKRCRKILEGYEDRLHLVSRFLRIKGQVKEINHLLSDEMMENGDSLQRRQLIFNVKDLTNTILEEL